MMPLYPATPSPKRKRDERIHSPHARVVARRLGTSSERRVPSSEENLHSETSSPRPKVQIVHQQGSLEMEEAGGVSRLGLFKTSRPDSNEAINFTIATQKSKMNEIPETPQSSYRVPEPAGGTYRHEHIPLANDYSHVSFVGANSTYFSPITSTTLPTRPSHHQQPISQFSSPEQRSPTPEPPPTQRLSPEPSLPIGPEGTMSQDPVSLHWHDSEITGHDPSDPEDDGEGINGIGFKPTAAIARSRSERRRKQLAEYKSREDKEARDARAKRIAGRKGVRPGSMTSQNQTVEKERRVRFLEAERAIDVL